MNLQKKFRSMKLTCNYILPRSVTASSHQSNTSLIFFLLSLPHLTLNPHFKKIPLKDPNFTKLEITLESSKQSNRIWYVCMCNVCVEGDGTPLQSSCLENPMDRGAW